MSFVLQITAAPVFEFVDSNIRGEPQGYTNLRCVAGGNPPPLVSWIRGSDNQVIANETGAVGVTVNIADTDIR